jgi:hypothetical protein
MNNDYVQNLRYKLQKRFRRVNSADSQVFHFALAQFWNFLQGNSLCAGVLEGLARRMPDADTDAEKICEQHKPLVFGDELENVAVAYFVIKRCLASDKHMPEVKIAMYYSAESGSSYNDILESFKTLFVEPLYEYVDEQLDDQISAARMNATPEPTNSSGRGRYSP